MNLEALLLDHQGTLALGAFLGVLVAMGAWELAVPRRRLRAPIGPRWLANFGLTVANLGVVRIAFPLAAVGVAAESAARGVGLLNALELPAAAAIALTVLALDLASWALHVVQHRVPVLWRVHRVHHSDVDVDVSTALRFHPGGALLTFGVRLAVVAALGAPVAGVVLYEALYTAMNFWGHANARVPDRLEPFLRWLVVTPDLHRVHHATRRSETDSNYGTIFTLWDRAFGCLRPHAFGGPVHMEVGLAGRLNPGEFGLVPLLLEPFRGGPGPGGDVDTDPGERGPRRPLPRPAPLDVSQLPHAGAGGLAAGAY